MASSSTVPIAIPIVFASLAWTGLGYTILKYRFPGKGLKVLKNVFRKTTTFGEAVRALKEGKRIRRKRERRGYTKIFLIEGKNKREVYAIYYADRKDEPEASIHNDLFSIEDVLATDWLVDE